MAMGEASRRVAARHAGMAAAVVLAAACVLGAVGAQAAASAARDVTTVAAAAAPADAGWHDGGGAQGTSCSVDACVGILSDDGRAFEWDSNGNGIPEIYAIDAVRDPSGAVTGFHLYTTCEMDYDGVLDGAAAIDAVIPGEAPGGGPELSILYRDADGATMRATVRVVDGDILISQG